MSLPQHQKQLSIAASFPEHILKRRCDDDESMMMVEEDTNTSSTSTMRQAAKRFKQSSRFHPTVTTFTFDPAKSPFTFGMISSLKYNNGH
jgi:hypothetical protein